MSNSLVKLLIKIYEHESIKKATRDYLLDNDDFSIFMEKYFEETDNADHYVPIKKMTEMYKLNFLRSNSRAYRTMTKKRFIELMKENEFWKHKFNMNYKGRYQKDGVNLSDVLLRIREKNELDEEISE